MKTALRQTPASQTLRAPRRHGASLLALAITGVFLGCDSPPDSATITVSDSTGTRIVTYASLDDEAFPVIDLEPRVDTIGAVAGADEYLFRILFSAELVPQGIVTADLFNSELRLFDRSGRRRLFPRAGCAGQRSYGPHSNDCRSATIRTGRERVES